MKTLFSVLIVLVFAGAAAGQEPGDGVEYPCESRFLKVGTAEDEACFRLWTRMMTLPSDRFVSMVLESVADQS